MRSIAFAERSAVETSIAPEYSVGAISSAASDWMFVTTVDPPDPGRCIGQVSVMVTVIAFVFAVTTNPSIPAASIVSFICSASPSIHHSRLCLR